MSGSHGQLRCSRWCRWSRSRHRRRRRCGLPARPAIALDVIASGVSHANVAGALRSRKRGRWASTFESRRGISSRLCCGSALHHMMRRTSRSTWSFQSRRRTTWSTPLHGEHENGPTYSHGCCIEETRQYASCLTSHAFVFDRCRFALAAATGFIARGAVKRQWARPVRRSSE